MSELLQYIRTRKYIVTANSYEDLDVIYEELETKGKSPPGLELFREIECIDKRPSSRSTVYKLTEWEAGELQRDPRIKKVEPHPEELGIQAGINSTTQTSTAWDKSGATSSPMKNWALLRCTEGQQRTGWGGTGYEGNGSGTAAQTGTITLTQTGRNVDVVIIDENGLVWNHPEYARNADGTGGTRTVQYNWFQHDPAVKGTGAGTYVYGTGSHSSHVAGTVAGNTQGWARDANIYNIYYLAGDPGTGAWDFQYVMDYVRQFHANKPVNPATGRKNPTITNNSWGMSIFPGEWAFTDITAVTYRGVRYTPTGTTTFLGTSGVCTSTTRLAFLQGLENAGNRIVTSGPATAPGGTINNKPASWTQDSPQSVYIAELTEPASSYVISLSTTGSNTVVRVKSDIASGGSIGITTLTTSIQIVRSIDNTVVASFSQGPLSSDNGGDVSVLIDENVTLAASGNYTITYSTTLSNAGVANPLTAFAMLTTINTTPTTENATVTTIANSLLGAASLTSSTVPSVGGNDDGYWTLNIPFNIEYLGSTYNVIYPSTNFYLTFGSGSTVWSGVSVANPGLPKIMWCARDNSVQRIYYGTEGIAPNRTYRVRMEGNASTSGTLGNPGMVCEYVFYEANPSRIDLQVGINNAKQVSGGFTTEQLNQWGFISGQRIPARVASLDSDIEDAMDEGIIFVGAAGNGRWRHCVPEEQDWDNTFEMGIRYPASVNNPYYYMRGTSPTANDNTTNGDYDLPNICVGSIDSIQIDQKVLYSDCGQGVDIWAPGTNIISVLPSGTSDPRNSGYYLGKYNGTSMASPQVCGVLACALELYPHWKQEQAKAYITGIAKLNQLTERFGGPADGQDLQGAPNKTLYYKKERESAGNVFPKTNYNVRPTAGSVYPRPRIRRTI